MKTYKVRVYSFDELGPKAKKKAISKHRDLLMETFEPQFLTDDFKYQLEEVGLPTKEVYWSLNNCQGDGVGFYGPVDLDKYAKHKGIELPREPDADGNEFADVYSFRIEKIGRYDHQGSGRVEYEDSLWCDPPESWEALASSISDQLQEDYRTWSNKLERQGYDEIEYEGSDENVIESLRANDYEFYSDGTVYRQHKDETE